MSQSTSADSARSSSVVAAAAYADGCRVSDIRVENARYWAKQPGYFVWIGLHEPTDMMLRIIQAQFDLHELAVEDALNAHQRPKLELYGQTLFVVLPTAKLGDDGRIVFGETHIFVGKGFVVTVRHGASTSYTPVRARCEANQTMLREGEDFVLYALMDFIVDNYAPVLEALEEEMEFLHHRLLRRSPNAAEVERIFRVRRDLERMRRLVTHLVDICHIFEHHDLPAIGAAMRPYYRDVSDHVLRTADMIASLRELLSFVFDTSMMVASSRQNDVSRKLTAGAALLAVPTAIAGIYGMNFENMPELKSPYGYYVVLTVIVVLCTILYRKFRKIGWL